MTPHINAKKEDISNIVLMPGDPLRAKLIADNFLEDAVLVNEVRGILAYTGFYKGKRLTVMASGMGIPSMGIYCYELFKFYDVESIIRIGSCGCYSSDCNLFDILLVDNVYSESNFALTLNNDVCHLASASTKLNKIIEDTSNEINIDYTKCNSFCSEAFDTYITDISKLFERFPKDMEITAAEMEAFALFYVANLLNKQAACLLSIVDIQVPNSNDANQKHSSSSDERQNSLTNMIKLALESAIKL